MPKEEFEAAQKLMNPETCRVNGIKIFADGAVVWHNTDDKLTSVAQSIKNLRAIKDATTVFHYEDIRREPTPTTSASSTPRCATASSVLAQP